MSILRSLAAPERRYTAQNQDWGSSRIPTNGEVGRSAAGMQVNTDSILCIAAAYTCTAIIADAISSLPLQTYARTKDHANVAIEPAPPLIVNPWPDRSRESWLNQVMVSLLIRGNAFGFIAARDDRGYPSAIQILDPDTVAARMVAGQREYRIAGRVIPTSSIMHISALSPIRLPVFRILVYPPGRSPILTMISRNSSVTTCLLFRSLKTSRLLWVLSSLALVINGSTNFLNSFAFASVVMMRL